MEGFREMQRRLMERTALRSYNSSNSVPLQFMRGSQEEVEFLLENGASSLTEVILQHPREGTEDWESDLPTIQEIHINIINWLRPVKFDDRLDALLELDGSLRIWGKHIKQQRKELRAAFQSSEVCEAQT